MIKYLNLYMLTQDSLNKGETPLDRILYILEHTQNFDIKRDAIFLLKAIIQSNKFYIGPEDLALVGSLMTESDLEMMIENPELTDFIDDIVINMSEYGYIDDCSDNALERDIYGVSFLELEAYVGNHIKSEKLKAIGWSEENIEKLKNALIARLSDSNEYRNIISFLQVIYDYKITESL